MILKENPQCKPVLFEKEYIDTKQNERRVSAVKTNTGQSIQ